MDIPFEVVPFNNGTNPTDPEHNLPHITSVVDLNMLSAAHCKSYVKGYYPEIQDDQILNSVQECRVLIRRAIGCTVEL
jgi:hypothetical protein